MARPLSLRDLRAVAIAGSLFAPTTLAKAIERLGFVQADPIRAPARAQDLTLRHRVVSYRVGDLDRGATRLRYAAPQLATHLGSALDRARRGSPSVRIDGVDWTWPKDGNLPRLAREDCDERVRFLAPFDPVVWDRRRFELFWGWAYRFEAYTPVKKRKLGYYALPLLWRDDVIGWGNLAWKCGRLEPCVGYVSGVPPRDRAFKRELEAEVERIRAFLGLTHVGAYIRVV
jgi:uncharacterized protein YcaQ